MPQKCVSMTPDDGAIVMIEMIWNCLACWGVAHLVLEIGFISLFIYIMSESPRSNTVAKMATQLIDVDPLEDEWEPPNRWNHSKNQTLQTFDPVGHNRIKHHFQDES